jgi:hypothetical protein
MRQDTTLFASGTIGNSQAQNTSVASIALVTPGRFRLWGMTRHTLADGLKITSPVAITLAGGPNDTVVFGPIVVDVNTVGAFFTVQLNVATGASDTAAATIYAEKINH